MQNTDNTILDSSLIKPENSKRRRSLLPWWIKTFTWIFLIFSLIVPVGIGFGLFGLQFQISLYGFSTDTPLSFDGLFLMALFLLKGITAFGLWTEKDWAINAGQIDAVLGIITCGFMMFIYPFTGNHHGYQMNIRLELVLLIPFLLKLIKIKSEWDKLDVTNIRQHVR
ncbi:MAG TPA: hypothetical protein VIH57_03595 [Bacteroidales bacterium]